MLWSLVWAAFLMGLVGGPHCLAMCAAPCHAVIQGSREISHRQTLYANRWSKNSLKSLSGFSGGAFFFHAGRLIGYGLLGALASQTMEQIAWLAGSASWLHSVWVLMHLAVLAWGLQMVFQGAQPAWLEQLGRSIWSKVQAMLQLPAGTFLTGMAWALMPCGLLYAAVLMAALSGNALVGSLSMVGFALGGGLWLTLAPYTWKWLSGRAQRIRAEWGVRAGGGMLVGVALWALWMDLIYKPAMWCR